MRPSLGDLWPHDDDADPTFPRPHYYAVSLMSHYLGGRNSTHSLYSESDDGDVFIAATAPGGSEYSVLVVNGVDSEKSIAVRLNRPLRRSLCRYVYNPATIQPDAEARLIGYSAELRDVSSQQARPRDVRLGLGGWEVLPLGSWLLGSSAVPSQRLQPDVRGHLP